MPRIKAALKEYSQERADKRGVLLTASGRHYYLYGDRFCPISDVDVTLISDNLCIQGSHVPQDIFCGLTKNILRWAATEDTAFCPQRLNLIFHIAFEREENLLRGILFARKKEAYLSLFTNPEIETLHRAASDISPQMLPHTASQNEELLALAQQYDQNNLHILTELYLHGQRLKGENLL